MRDDRDELLELARDVVRRAKAHVDVAEVSVGSSWELSAKVRLGQPELVEEAGQRGVSLRVLRGGRLAMTSTSDTSPAGIELLVRDAVELVELAEPDPFAGPADPAELAAAPFADLDTFDPSVSDIDAAFALESATRAEAAALAYDPRITLSEGATYGRSVSTRAMVLSSGFEGVTRGTYASLSVVPVVVDSGDKRRRGYYWSARRHRADLEDGRFVGEEAARRTLAKLGSRKVKTGEAAIVFDADSARSILSTFAGTIVGSALWRKSSYLLDRLGTEVASPLVTIIDDPGLPRAPGSRAFDGEGLRSRRNVVVQAGKLETFLLDCYSARKLGRVSTASAARSGGSIGPSTTNFFLEAGTGSREELIASTQRGLLVTEMMGFGFNALTGDFSRGAGGFWIEDGRIVHPVSEVTIGSNLDTMLRGIDRVANDLELKSSTASPTFRVNSMTISGE
ncbi:MAG TPA: metallopeptidase TldD-related protein [Polyangiaceae bacterium]|nr:metallopeptidase TldD-related protein [Polyangiaceae bacterium]